MFFSADATTSQISPTRTTRASRCRWPALLDHGCDPDHHAVTREDRTTRPPPASARSDMSARAATLSTVPDEVPFRSRRGASRRQSPDPSRRALAVARIRAARAAPIADSRPSIQRTAMSLTGSLAITRAATLRSGASCTSTEVSVPTPRWFVTINPFGSITTPDACVVGVHSSTTLPCHRCSRVEGLVSGVGAPPAVEAMRARASALAGSIRPWRRVRRRRPRSASTGNRSLVCVGPVRLHGVSLPGAAALPRAIEPGQDAAGRRAWRVVADEQRMRATGIAFCSASTRDALMCRTPSSWPAAARGDERHERRSEHQTAQQEGHRRLVHRPNEASFRPGLTGALFRHRFFHRFPGARLLPRPSSRCPSS